MKKLHTVRWLLNHPLNRGQKTKALARYIKWQVGSRLVPGAVAFDWVNGSRFVVRRGETGLTGNVYAGLHEYPEMAFLLHYLRPDDLFVDVGANVGSYSILAGSVGASGVAFEPVPNAFARLETNMRLNRMDVQCVNAAVGSEAGEIAFSLDRDTANHVARPDDARTATVPLQTLDSALAGRSPALVKIDVEGFEAPVVEGGLEVLSRTQAVIMELNGLGKRYGFDESCVLGQMAELGFAPCTYDPATRGLAPLNGKSPNSDNTLFIRDMDAAQERVSNAPVIRVQGREI